jgi:hypothetical protein
MADLPAAERLERYLEQGFLSLQRAPLLSKLMVGDRQMLLQLNELGDDLREQMQEMQLKALTAMVQGIGSFDTLSPRERGQRVRVLLGMLMSATELNDERVRGNLSAEVYARHLAKIVVSGVGAP